MTIEQLAEAIARADAAWDAAALAALASSRTVTEFAARQIEWLGPLPEEELKERAGKRSREVAARLSARAERIMRSVYGVESVEALARLDGRALLTCALQEHYRPLSPARIRRRYVGAVGVRDDLAYGVFVSFDERQPPETLGTPGVVTPEAMTFVREGDGWFGMLDGGLSVRALKVFAPGA